MSNSQVVSTIFNGGLKSTHYFNGRLLSADALLDDQQAAQTRQFWLGKASGYGIIEGLLVSKTPNDTTQINVTNGIGINHNGHVISLPNDITFAPISTSPPAQKVTAPKLSEDVGQFTPRIVLEQKVQAVELTSPGVYLLTLAPTTHYEGQVPMKAAANGISNGIGSTTPGIGNRWEVEGVSVKIIRLDDENLPNLYATAYLTDFKVNANTCQNMLAHWCYGTLTLKDIGRNPFLFQRDYSPLETLTDFRTLSELDLDSSDLPLAVFHWDGAALSFVDTWSVRRRIVLPDALSGMGRYPLWKALVSDEHRAENQARFLQFQDQLDALIQLGQDATKVNLAKVQATDYFGFLPPVGFLPVTYDSLHKIVCTQSYGGKNPPETGTGQTGQTGDTGSTGGMFNLGRLFSAIGNFAPLVSFFNPAAGSALALTRAAADPQSLQNLQAIGETLGGLTSAQPGQSANELTRGTEATSATAAAQMLVSTVEGQQVQIPVQMVPPTQPPEQGQTKSRGFRPLHEIVQEQVCALLSENPNRNPAGCFDLSQFFYDLTLHLYLIGNDSIDFILHQSWNEEAIDLIHAPSPHKIVEFNRRNTTLAKLPFIIDIYLVEENLRDTTAPLYVMFHKAHHPGELIEGYNLPNVTRLL